MKRQFMCVRVWVTCDGRATHKVCVGEVQGGVEQEVGLGDVSRSLTDIVEEASALHRHSALVAVLQAREKRKKKRLWHALKQINQES